MTEDEIIVLNRIRKRISFLAKVFGSKETSMPDFCTMISTNKKRRYYKYGISDSKYSYTGYPHVACIGMFNTLCLKTGPGVFKYFLFKERERKISEFAHSLGLKKIEKLIDCYIAYNLDSHNNIQDITYISIGKDANDMPYILSNEDLEIIDLEIIRKRKLAISFARQIGDFDLELISCSEDVYKTNPLMYEDSYPCLIGFDYLNRPIKVYYSFADSYLRSIKVDKPFVNLIEERLKAYE